jgi:hypothetical protein
MFIAAFYKKGFWGKNHFLSKTGVKVAESFVMAPKMADIDFE